MYMKCQYIYITGEVYLCVQFSRIKIINFDIIFFSPGETEVLGPPLAHAKHQILCLVGYYLSIMI